MADVAVTPTALAVDVASADILDADGTAITDAAANQWVVALAGRPVSDLLLKFLDDGSGCNITIKAGPHNPNTSDRGFAHRGALGDYTFALAASDCKYLRLSGGRFEQLDGTIHITATDNGAECKAFLFNKDGQ